MFPAERHFVKTALRQMLILENFWSTEIQPALVAVEGSGTAEAFEAIKASACTVQARGVYRAAVMCEDIFARLGAEGAAKLRTSLIGLKSLIEQYADGLFEIDSEFKTIIDGGTAHKDMVKDVGLESLEAAQKIATETLKPLLGLVKSNKVQSALGFLMGGAFEEEVQPRARVNFETIMQPVTNLTLSEARYNGKNISLSYAADFDDLDKGMAECVQSFLEILCLNIVSRGVEDAASQISLTGQRRERHLVFTVNWRGRDIAANINAQPHFKQAVKTLKKNGGKIEYHQPALSDNGNAAQSLEVYFARAGVASHEKLDTAHVQIGSAI